MKNQNRLVVYWGITLFYGLLWLADLFREIDSFGLVIIICIPLSIAGYFTCILESIKKEI